MSYERSIAADCKVNVRKYVLIAAPSRLGQKGQRVVVQSPMIHIPKSATHVPVRRFHGEEENSVLFIPKSDIEKDSSIVYERVKVLKSTTYVDAHGVALYDSAPSSKFQYKKGHKFWICISASADEGTEAPVVNLETFKEGMIPIDKVCWYPKIRTADGLWTPGGPTRRLKLAGVKKFNFFSWVIWQSLDSGERTIKASISIPAKDECTGEVRHLDLAESRSLFEKQYRAMNRSLNSHQPSNLEANGLAVPLPPTPLTTPDLDRVKEKLQEVKSQQRRGSSGCSSPATDVSVWKRIMDMLPARRRTRQYMLRNCEINTSTPPENCGMKRRHSLIEMEGHSEAGSEEDGAKSDVKTCSQISSRSATPPRRHSEPWQATSPILVEPDPSVLDGARVLIDIFRDHEQPFFSITPPSLSPPQNIIFRTWSQNPLPHNPKFEKLCDQNNYHCPYNTMFPFSHVHSPAHKCTLGSRNLLFSVKNDEDHDLGSLEEHDHCITRLGALPGRAGGCILASMPFTSSTLSKKDIWGMDLYRTIPHPTAHTCCRWDAEHLSSIPSAQRPDSVSGFVCGGEGRRTEEYRRKRIRLLDRSSLIERRLEMEQSICLKDSGEAFGLVEEGRRLLDLGFEDADLRVDFDLGNPGNVSGDELLEELLSS